MDKTIRCVDCGDDFIFSDREQEFFKAKGLQSEPKRCKGCRAAKKGSRSDGDFRSERGPEAGTEVTCSGCGVQTTVPFKPRGNRPVYCRACFAASK